MVLPGDCSRMKKAMFGGVLLDDEEDWFFNRGCGYASHYSRFTSIGYGGAATDELNNNVRGERSSSTKAAGVAGTIFSALPWVRVGAVDDELNDPTCENLVNWDVPEAC